MDKEDVNKAKRERLILSLLATQPCGCLECQKRRGEIYCKRCRKKGRVPWRLPQPDLMPSNYDDWCDLCFLEATPAEKFRRVTAEEKEQMKIDQQLKREAKRKLLEQREAEKLARKAERKKHKKVDDTGYKSNAQQEREAETKRNLEEQRQMLESIWNYNADD